MLIATHCPLTGPARHLEAFVQHNSRQVDLLVFGYSPRIEEDRRDALARFQSQVLPILVSDLPDGPPGEPSRLATLLSNLERFFRLDAVVLLEANELIFNMTRRRSNAGWHDSRLWKAPRSTSHTSSSRAPENGVSAARHEHPGCCESEDNPRTWNVG